jgi:thiol:disulfide interchange protein DsbG
MNIPKSAALAAAFAAATLLAACDKSPESSAAAPAAAKSTAPVSVDLIQKEATGFVVGSPMNVRTVYVFFDAQCPHCAALWNSAKPLKSQTKFVWIPVGILNKSSTTQGATILASSDPAEKMEENEASIIAKGGGITATAGDDVQAKVKKNTELFTKFGFESIPTIVALHAQTGQLVRREGALPTNELAVLLGLNPPAQ